MKRSGTITYRARMQMRSMFRSLNYTIRMRAVSVSAGQGKYFCSRGGLLGALSPPWGSTASGSSSIASSSCNSSRSIVPSRAISSSIHRLHQDSDTYDKTKKILLRWQLKNGDIKETHAHPGMSILTAARHGEVDLEGSCEGSCACSTCHVIMEESQFDALPGAGEDEEDMLDQAFGLTPTSRLGCQVFLHADHDGMTIRLPKATRNMYVDGHVPKPH